MADVRKEGSGLIRNNNSAKEGQAGQKNGAAEGSRTLDVQLGKLTFYH